jgi:hypothetical protein
MFNSDSANKVHGILSCLADDNELAEEVLQSRYGGSNYESALNISIGMGFIKLDGLYVIALYKSLDHDAFYREYVSRASIKFSTPLNFDKYKCVLEGRAYFIKELTPNEKQLFSYANLLDGENLDVVEWWDSFSSKFRNLDSEENLVVGREGEKLTLAYERFKLKPLGLQPKWISIDDNNAGYDVLSFEESEEIKIEVKSTETESGILHLTRNQYEKMKANPQAHRIHLWRTNSKQLAILTIEDIQPHAPIDNGKGYWHSFDLYFNTFNSKFNAIPDHQFI